MRIYIPEVGTPTILRTDRDAYLKYRVESEFQAAPIETLVWADWRIYPFEAPVYDSLTHKVTTNPVETFGGSGTYTFEVVAKTQAELDADLVVERQGMVLSRLQFRKGVNASGAQKRADLDVYIAGLTQDEKDEWSHATVYPRLSPLVLGIQTALNLTDNQLDNFFRNSATL